MPLVFAAHFLAFSILTLLLPVGLLLAIATWHTLAAMRLRDVESEPAPRGPRTTAAHPDTVPGDLPDAHP